jgi:ABC-type taurine transport system substrate-binding protein
LDSDSLQLAELGSTPLAMALARGLDIKVVYIEHYKGESQGIYARPSGTNYTGIQNPFDLEGRRLGVPFGSTMHYQLLYMLDIFDLTGKVELLNLSPTEIMEEWDAENIDAAACWGVARQHILDQYVPANTLLTSGVLADWGRPTFNVVAVHTPFLNSNLKFVERFVRILSLLTDSFIDNLGVVDYGNVLRWAPKTFSYMTDVSDSLMKPGAMKGAPSIDFINTNRLIMDLFVQKSTEEQLSCDYLGGVNQCSEPSFIHIAIQQTAEFLMGQKLIQSMGPLEDLGDDTSCNQANTLCGGDTFAGWVLSSARSVFSSITLDSLDSGGTAEGYEIGRNGGDSTCRSSESSELTASGQRKSFGDGANVQDGKSYSGTNFYRVSFLF